MTYQVHGTFTCMMDLSRYTRAQAFGSIGLRTPITMVTSTVTVDPEIIDDVSDDEDFDLCFHCPSGDLNIAIRQHGPELAEVNQYRIPSNFWSKMPQSLLDIVGFFSAVDSQQQSRFLAKTRESIDLVTNEDGQRFLIEWFLTRSQNYHRSSQYSGGALVSKQRGGCRHWRLMAQVTPAIRLNGAAANSDAFRDRLGCAEATLLEVGQITFESSVSSVSAGFDDNVSARDIHTQVGYFYRELSDEGRANLVVNLARSLIQAEDLVRTCMIQQLNCASLDLGHRLAAELEALGKQQTAQVPIVQKWNRLARLAENGLSTVHAHCL